MPDPFNDFDRPDNPDRKAAVRFRRNRRFADHPSHLASRLAALEAMSIPEPNTGCWLWLGSLFAGTGYARFGALGEVLGHRSSWTLHHGTIPDGLVIMHKCDQPSCVNPSHLVPGTYQDNTQDSINKGRFKRGKSNPRRGESHYNARLSNDQVSIIRASDEPAAPLARQLGVSESTIRDVRKGRSWNG